MSHTYSAVSRRRLRAFASVAAVLFLSMGGIAAANTDLPAHSTVTLQPAPKPVVETPPAPPPPEFAFETPLPGHEIGSPFGLRRLPWEPAGRMHEGVDIAAPSGQAVLATCAGTITRSGVSSSYGRYVEVAHAGGFTSLYAHLGRAAKGLKNGDAVLAGEAVGYVGNTGHSTGPHVHFELRKDGKAMNPAMFLGHQFATAAELPLKAAGHVSRQVRLAQVSSTPGWTRVSNVTRRGARHRVHAVLAAAD